MMPKIFCQFIIFVTSSSLRVTALQFTDLDTEWPPFGFLHPQGFFLGFPVEQDDLEVGYIKVQGWVDRANPNYNSTTSVVDGKFTFVASHDRWEYSNRDIDFEVKDTFYYNVTIVFNDIVTETQEYRTKNFKIFIDNNTYYDLTDHTKKEINHIYYT